MLESQSYLARSLFFSFAILGMSACVTGREAPFMKPVPPAGLAYRSDAQTATVVFGIAQRRMTTGHVLTVLDEDGKFVGDLQARSAFATPVSPGRHMFVLMAYDDTEWDVLFADVRAGSIYYIDVIDGVHPLTDRRQPYFWPSKPGGDPSYTLSTLPEHLKDSTWLEPDVGAGNRFLAMHATDVQSVMKDANERRKSAEQSPGLITLIHTLVADDALRP
jgi:hypothetical protein